VLVCGSCGEENPERFRFCGACGAPLGAPARPATEERKVVSVLFVDLVGFTARSDQADPEDVSARLRPYHATLKREIEKFGGTVEKFIGDAVMAVFGAPVAHEDDAERGVRAALRIIEAIEELNQAHPGLELSVRAAVNTGEALASLSARPERGEGIVTGDVVNTAARLQGVAPVGGVAVGELTYRTTRSAIEYAPLQDVMVKGKQEPLRIWHALRARGRSTEIEQASTPFIGRDAELVSLQQAFRRVVQGSSVELVTVIGEPGVGKSRLMSEFFTWVSGQPELVLWRHGRCPRYGEEITFWALGEIIKAQAGILDSDEMAAAAAKLSTAVDAVVEAPEREWVKTLLAPLVGSSTGTASTGRAETFAAWLTFIESIASRAPLILVVEDLHWADDVLVEFIQYVAKRATDVPLLILCTARPEVYERHPGWAGEAPGVTTITLSPLSGEETGVLISTLLAEMKLPEATQQKLLERSGGNPLYAEEFVRMLADQGVLESGGDAAGTASDAVISVPETVQALIAARLDTLPSDRKALMYDAAVLGRVFWSSGAATMADRPEAEVRQSLHELARKEFVRPARQASIEGQAEYAFWHILVQDVAYRQIPRAARSSKHRAAAEWLEEVAGQRVGDHAEILAFHYTQALRLALTMGSADEKALLAQRAVEFLVASGDRAVHLDQEKAGSFYRRALELIAQDDPRRGRILVKLGLVDSDRGLHEDAQRDFEAAIDALRAAGDRVGAGEALALLARTVWRQGEGARARTLAAEAVSILESEPPGPERVDAYNEVGRLAMVAARFDEAIRCADDAIRGAQELGLQRPLVRALVNRGVARGHLGDHESGIDDLRSAQRLALELGLGLETIPTFGNLAFSLGDTAGPQDALSMASEGVEFAERRGFAFPAAMLKTIRAEFCFKLGRWDETVALTDEVLEWERTHRAGQVRARAIRERCRVLALRGPAELAAAPLEELLTMARKAGDPQTVIPILALAATIELAREQPAAAIRLAREILTADAPDYRLRELAGTVRVLIRCGAVGDAEAQMQGLTPTTPRHRAVLASARAEMAEARNDLAGGAALHGEAAEAWSRFGDVVEHAWALLGQGRCLTRLGDLDAATDRLRAAREAFVGFGAEPLIAETDDWLGQAVLRHAGQRQP
jgi:class 3 adenylate cyclase/tetratricopeptide (TPR) repeat protein